MQNQFVDLYRNGIKTAAEIARTSLENSVRLQEKQLDIVRNVLDENTRSADRLTEARNMEDLISVQTRLAGAQMERVAEFWSTLWQAAAENQKAFINQMQSQIGQANENLRETYASTMRGTEDMARTAASQVSRTAGAIREGATAANQTPERKPQEGHRKSA